jgi:hypothetical protein
MLLSDMYHYRMAVDRKSPLPRLAALSASCCCFFTSATMFFNALLTAAFSSL